MIPVVTVHPAPQLLVPCESVTTCREIARWKITNRVGTVFRLCDSCAAPYLERLERRVA